MYRLPCLAARALCRRPASDCAADGTPTTSFSTETDPPRHHCPSLPFPHKMREHTGPWRAAEQVQTLFLPDSGNPCDGMYSPLWKELFQHLCEAFPKFKNLQT